jgi:hypothetical protein
MTNSYHRIKDFVFTNLKKKNVQLTDGQISEEISNTQKLIETAGLEMFAMFLPEKDPIENLAEEDWERMGRELEKHFDVKMNEGILIQGDEQQQRDTTWWSNKEKQRGENYYWDRYKNNYISGFLPPEVIDTLDKDTDRVMNNIGDPHLDGFLHRGMVVGHVQSGKTGNYSGLVCKAADAGYKFIVVIAGGTNNLRNQTQKRLNEAFVGLDKGVQVGSGVGNSKKELLPISLTTTERDFNKTDADRNSQGMNFDNIKVPILIVIKKNTHALKNVITWLKNQYKNKISDHAMLVIDDESDYASINTKQEEDPTSINRHIRKLLSLFRKGSYVAYTATPYANIFIDHEAVHEDLGDDLFPKDFIFALDAPSDYFGARKVFLDSNDKHLIAIPESDYTQHIPLNHKIDFPLPTMPESLSDAVRLFIINVAIRRLRGHGKQHNSMLIHASRFTNLHKKLAAHVERYVSAIKKDINAFGKLTDAVNHSSHIRGLKETLDLRLEDRSAREIWKNVLDSICETINTIIVREVHQSTKIPLEYRDDIATNAIVVGGASLSRGFTLEGLSVSYFLRNTVFYDTLMQMGRWFGYRPGYEDLCRVYLPQHTIDYFRSIIEATEDLIQDLKIMAENNLTPSDFGLAVKQHPDSALQVTARNKQKNVREFVFSMRLDGQLKETAWLPSDVNDRASNFKAIENTLDELQNREPEKVGSSLLWRNTEKGVVKKFLEDFKVYKTDPLGITARMPIEFIKKYVTERDTKWDVAIYSGKGGTYERDSITIKKEERALIPKAGYFEVGNRQVSSGNAEAVALTEKQRKDLNDDRKAIRAVLPNPLLMLHILDTKEGEFAAFGVSFPGNVLSQDETVKLKINTVYYENLLKELEDETNDE